MKRPWKLVVLLFTVALSTVLLTSLLQPKPADAANPTTISFQGKVVNANGTNVSDGTYTFVFKLYTVSTGGTAVWTETDSLTVAAGTFQVNLGASCSFFTAATCNNNAPIDFNANPALYLGITFNSDPAGEMTPRVQLQSVPYAYNADKVGGLTAAQLVELSPGSQQSGNVNVTGVITPSLTSTGALTINSGAATNVSIDSAGVGTAAINIGPTNATAVNISRTGETTEVKGALQVDQTSTFNNSVVMTFTGTENLSLTSALGGTVNGISFIGTPSATAGTVNGAFIQQAASANTNGLDNGLTIDNANTSLVIGNAINITNSGGGGYTNYIYSPNFIVTGTGQIDGKGLDYFDPSTLTGTSTTLGSGGTTGGNFGGVLATGAVIDNTDTYDQEFVGSIAAATTNNANAGDDGLWYFNNNAQAVMSGSDISTDGGYYRITTGTTTGRGGLIVEGATPGTIDAPLAAANLPIVQMKVRPSILRVTDDMVWGMMDTATAPTTNDTLPTNGIFFWTNNNLGTSGWTGVVRRAGTTVGTVTCPGTMGTNFATGRIVVVNATTVNFFIDNDATAGISMQDCGVVTGTLPTANMAMGMYVIQTTTTSETFDLDYARFWQDDSAPSDPAQAANDVAAEQTEADISTGSDESDSLTTAAATGTDPSDPTVTTSDDTTPAVQPVQTSSSVTGSNFQVQLAPGGASQIMDGSGTVVATIDDTGDATFNGNLSVANATLSGGLAVGGDTTFAGLSTFQKLATFLAKTVFRQDVEFDGHLTVANDTAGYATLRSGESTVHVSFNNPYDNPPIVTANIVNGQFGLTSVNNVTGQGFDISLSAAATAPTTFSWTAIGVINPQTASNPLPVTTPTTSTN